MNLESGEFVEMPNHIHGIIMIGENEYNTAIGKNAMDCVSKKTQPITKINLPLSSKTCRPSFMGINLR